MRRTGTKALLTAIALLAAGAAAWAMLRPEPKGPLALFTSLPRASSLIEVRRAVRPLDRLTPETLAPYRDLLLAQPRALAPAENAALDGWVRGGGRLLLFADPLPAVQSGAALPSAILGHWGLDLHFGEHRKPGEAAADVMGIAVPTDRAGSFTTRGQKNCELWGEGLAATCAIGEGRVVAVADAAVLKAADPGDKRRKALEGLLDTAFAAR